MGKDCDKSLLLVSKIKFLHPHRSLQKLAFNILSSLPLVVPNYA